MTKAIGVGVCVCVCVPPAAPFFSFLCVSLPFFSVFSPPCAPRFSSRCIIYSRCITLPFPFVPTPFFWRGGRGVASIFYSGFFFLLWISLSDRRREKGEREKHGIECKSTDGIRSPFKSMLAPPGGGGTNKSGRPFLAATWLFRPHYRTTISRCVVVGWQRG